MQFEQFSFVVFAKQFYLLLQKHFKFSILIDTDIQPVSHAHDARMQCYRIAALASWHGHTSSQDVTVTPKRCSVQWDMDG
jgi:hypothetical protein